MYAVIDYALYRAYMKDAEFAGNAQRASSHYQLFVGSYTGTIYQFTDIDNNINGQFTEVNSTAANIWDGGKSNIAIADINNDNQADMIIGNVSGGIAYFSSDSSLTDSTTTYIDINKNYEFNIFPNPAQNNFTVHSKENGNIKIYNLLGDIMFSTIKQEEKLIINTSSLSKGIYLIELNNKTQKISIK